MNTTNIKIKHPEMNEAPIPQDFFADLIQKRRSYACLANVINLCGLLMISLVFIPQKIFAIRFKLQARLLLTVN